MLLMTTFIDYRYIQGKNLKSTIDAGLCSRVLLELITGLDGHQLYTNKYYTSSAVYLELYKN